jgi:hypothetical protein
MRDAESVTADVVRSALTHRVNPQVLEVALQPTGEDGRPVRWWRIGGQGPGTDVYYLDDPTFGPPVNIEDLVLDTHLGLFKRKNGNS